MTMRLTNSSRRSSLSRIPTAQIRKTRGQRSDWLGRNASRRNEETWVEACMVAVGPRTTGTTLEVLRETIYDPSLEIACRAEEV